MGGHISRCKLNPNFKDLFKKIGKEKHNNANFKEYTFICECCGKEYKLILSENNYNKGKYKKHVLQLVLINYQLKIVIMK